MSTTDVSLEEATKATTKAGWKKSSVHTVRCPSGVYVDIKIPDLPALIEAGQIPQHLLEAALGAASGTDTVSDIERIKQQREFTDTLTALTVVSPAITPEEARDLPYEDKEMLVSIAMRGRDFDAEGEQIGGLNTSEKFRRFRRIGEFDEALEGIA